MRSTLQKKQCREDSKNPFEGKKVIFVENEEDRKMRMVSEDIWNL